MPSIDVENDIENDQPETELAGFENDEEIENPDAGVDLPNIDIENDFEGDFAEQVTPELENL